MIKLLIIDRDSTIVHGSSDPTSPFYYILDPNHLVLKPNVREAFDILTVLSQTRDLKVVMATRQRCISKGLITRPSVDATNSRLEDLIDFTFDAIYVEETAETKTDLFKTILRDTGARPDETLMIDDSATECNAATSLGMQAALMSTHFLIPCGAVPLYRTVPSLYEAICRTFSIT